MEIRQTIDGLRQLLENTISEEELLHAIPERLAVLRQSYRGQRTLFAPDDIEFLKGLSGIPDELRSFIEVKEGLADVATLDEYTVATARLVEIKNALATFRIATKVRKELRELQERLPAIRALDEASRERRVNTRIVGLEERAPRCRAKHLMVIRRGQGGYFWGCSRYPFCQHTAQLQREQGNRLTIQG